MSNPSQLYLLADHIKLSLLERQRAISLDLEPNAQNSNISRSLESMREGVEALEQEASELEDSGDSSAGNTRAEAVRLRSQYSDLDSQFRGFPTGSESITSPNDPSLSSDFDHATSIPSKPSAQRSGRSPTPKAVRFRDNPSPDAEETATRNALFPYRDDPSADLEAGPPDQSHLDNVQIHQYHDQVMRQQDEQLDRLGDSISRQRELSMQIGDELDEHVEMLDEIDEHVDRQQGTLDGARKRLGHFARKANDNKQLTVIAILIVILVLLIIILKR